MRFRPKQRTFLKPKEAEVEKLNTNCASGPQWSARNQGTELTDSKDLRDLAIEYRAPDDLTPAPNNSRIHSPKHVRQIAEIIRRFGFLIPMLVDQCGQIIAGHGRLLAAKQLGLHRVPTVRVDHLSEPQIRALMIADNRLTEVASWNPEMLAAEFKYLMDLDFDVSVTAFETAEIDLLLEENGTEKVAEADSIPILEAPVSQIGDVWLLLKHRLLCGDATKSEFFELLMSGRKAQQILTDPPYNVKIDGHASGLGSIRHREFAMAVGEMSEVEFIEFLTTIFTLLARHSVDGSLHFIFMDWRHSFELLSAARAVYSEFKSMCAWIKQNSGMGSLYRSQHELIFVLKNGSARHINNVNLGKFGRNRSNTWHYESMNSFHQGRLEQLSQHPTIKPLQMIADAILDCSRRGGLILDCFGGSGTTLITAQQTGRIAYLMELDPRYVDLTIRRFRKLTGEDAVHAATGRTFSDTEREKSQRDDAAIDTSKRRNKNV